MIKLFNRSKTIPTQYKPDRNLIAQLEKEFKLDDDGFDERYDKMLLDAFNEEHKNSKMEFDDRIEALYDLNDTMYSTEYRLLVLSLINEAKARRRLDMGLDVENLRHRMIERGKRRHN